MWDIVVHHYFAIFHQDEADVLLFIEKFVCNFYAHNGLFLNFLGIQGMLYLQFSASLDGLHLYHFQKAFLNSNKGSHFIDIVILNFFCILNVSSLFEIGS